MSTAQVTPNTAMPNQQPDQPVVVAFPHPSGDPNQTGARVQFPSADTAAQAAPSVWRQLYNDYVAPSTSTLGRELSAFGSAVNPLNLAKGIYTAAAEPLTPEEQEEFRNHTRIPGEVAVERLTGAPIVRAANWYKDAFTGKVPDAYEQALSVAPEGVGTSAGTVVLGKAVENTINAAKARILKAAPAKSAIPSEPVTAKAVSAEPVTPVAPMTQTERTAAAFIRRQRLGSAATVEEVVPKADAEGASPISTKKLAQKEVENLDANKIAADVLRSAKPTEGVSIENESESPKTTAEAADALARSFVTRLQQESTPTIPKPSAEPTARAVAPSTPANPPATLDITDEWKRAAQKELARQGVSGGSDKTMPTFFSKLERVASSKLPNAASGDQMLSTLRNNGVKPSEIEWTGTDDFLKGKAKVSKADLLAHINDHKISLSEVDYGTPEQRQMQKLSQERQKVYAENNNIWADHLRYADGSADMFNAMKQGSDLGIKQTISRMAPETQEPARRFVETDNQIRSLDDQLAKLQYQVEKSGARAPKYEKYAVPGPSENYTEKLLKLPQEPTNEKPVFSVQQSSSGHDWHVINDRGGIVLTAGTPEYAEARAAELNAQGLPEHLRDRDGRSGFRSSHFTDEPNIIAHIRYDERPTVDGEKALFINELQSDWHQRGTKIGYQQAPATDNDIDVKYIPRQPGQDPNIYPGYWESFDKRTGQLITRHGGRMDEAAVRAEAKTFSSLNEADKVPNAPFKTDWHELTLKRMLREAAEKGHDYLAWATGKQIANLYDLSKHVDSIDWLKSNDGTYSIAATKNGEELIRKDNLNDSTLSDLVGKDVAAKIRNSEGKNYSMQGTHNMGTLKGLDLQLSPKWAENLYDRALVNFANKYTKRWGSKVQDIEIPVSKGELERAYQGPTLSLDDVNKELSRNTGTVYEGQLKSILTDMKRGLPFRDAMLGSGSDGLAEKLGGKFTKANAPDITQKVHGVRITKPMRDSVMMHGQPIAVVKPSWANGLSEVLA